MISIAICRLVQLYMHLILADIHDRNIGIEAPPLTELVKNILQRYPEGGQILKVKMHLAKMYFSCVYAVFLSVISDDSIFHY